MIVLRGYFGFSWFGLFFDCLLLPLALELFACFVSLRVWIGCVILACWVFSAPVAVFGLLIVCFV